MVRNYRASYKEKFGHQSTLTDEHIWLICNTVFDDSDNKAEMDARLDTMLDREG